MSTYPTTVRARVSSSDARTIALWSALLAALVGAVLVLVIAVPDHNASTKGAAVGGRAQPLNPHSRFDGGPNEGTRGTVARQQADSSVIRFDGGPQEGTRGALTRPQVDSSVIRFDGGPQEGTRGAIVQALPAQAPTFDRGPRAGHVGDAVSPSPVTSPATSPTRFDGGPEEGTRGG